MSPAHRIQEIAVLQQNAVDYWYRVDHLGGEGVAGLFMPDGIFHAGPGDPLVGREAIEAFYAWRRQRGDRTSRHVITNFHADFASPVSARTTCVMQLFASDGGPPHAGTRPAMVADMIDDCIKGGDGLWRYARRDFRALWLSGAELTVAPDTLKS